MSSSAVSVRVENLGKCYYMYARPQDRLKQFIVPRLQRMGGLPPKNYFREFWALRDVSFEVRKGETVGIIGRNGSGKSTLLQIICGTLSPTIGEVATSGRIAALLELGSGFNPEFTGRENIYLNGAILGLSEKEVDSHFADIVAFADIGDFLEQPVKIYSSGMTIRLAFAVQAMIDPDILIVDEALAVGDEKFQRKCFARLEKLKSNGASILFVSHVGSQIIDLCDRALLLDHGMRLMFSPPLKAIRAYQELIYAPVDEQARIVKQYRAEDSTTGNDRVESDAASGQAGSSFFDASLVPETTQAYPPQGAQIDLFRILDTEGQVVNVLLPGKDYRFEVSGRFLSNSEGVHFGIHIRSVSGRLITGQRFPEEGRFVERVQAGKGFRITFGFKMILLPGAYFVGGGVWALAEPQCLHRVLDALMFRVTSEGKATATGLVDASSIEPQLVIL